MSTAEKQQVETLGSTCEGNEYHRYTLQKTLSAKDASLNVNDADKMEQEVAALIDVYDLRKMFKGIEGHETMTNQELIQAAKVNAPKVWETFKRCVNIFHERFGIDLEHGKRFLDNQVTLEGNAEAHLYNPVSTTMKTINDTQFVSLINVCDDGMLWPSVSSLLALISKSDNPAELVQKLHALVGTTPPAPAATTAASAAPVDSNSAQLDEVHSLAKQLGRPEVYPDEMLGSVESSDAFGGIDVDSDNAPAGGK